MFTNILILAMSLTLAAGQRPSFAGSRPIGFPEVIKTTTEGLGNRFGEGDGSTTTVRLPIEANGDKDLVDRLSKLPIDQQPFWFINWQAYEAHRQNPQTFPQKPNVFVDPPSGNTMNFNPSNNNMNFNPPGNNVNPSFNPGSQQSNSNSNTELSNRFNTDSLVPTTVKSETQTKPQEYTVVNGGTQTKPQEYIVVNGILYKIVASNNKQ